MSESIKDIISIFENLQNEYIDFYEKNSIDLSEINKFKEAQNIKLFEFKIKLRNTYISETNLSIKKEINILKDDSWWNLNYGK
jgi:hypothetical protein